MSYTGLDWLADQARDTHPWSREAMSDLLIYMREDFRGIVRGEEADAVVAHINDEDHDHGLCELFVIHWTKDRIDWKAG
jgi:hypothetical protein